MDEIEARRFLLEQSRSTWLRLKDAPVPEFKFRAQRRRFLDRKLRARRLAVVPIDLRKWLGRPLTQADRNAFAAAWRWFEQGNTLTPIRARNGRVVQAKLAMHTEGATT